MYTAGVPEMVKVRCHKCKFCCTVLLNLLLEVSIERRNILMKIHFYVKLTIVRTLDPLTISFLILVDDMSRRTGWIKNSEYTNRSQNKMAPGGRIHPWSPTTSMVGMYNLKWFQV